MADFLGKTKADKLGFMSNLANNGLAFAVQLGTTALAFPDYVAAVTAANAAQTDADAQIAAASAATANANALIDALVSQTRDMAAAGRTSTMSDADLLTLGISRRATSNSPVPTPTAIPVLSYDSLSPGAVVMRYTCPGLAGPRQKPPGAVSVEISLRPLASVQPAETGILQSLSKTPNPIRTDFLPPGTLKACARFVTQSGLKGPWSADLVFTSQPV